MTLRENKVLRSFLRFVLLSLLICVAAYQLLISNELANTYDGLWNGAEYRNYAWVVEIGRWFWPAVGMAQMNVCPEPFTSVLSLFFYVLGSCTVAWWFGLKNSMKGYLLVLLSVINTAVCVSLTYRYTSPTFGLAYLLSILAAWALGREKLLPWLASVICLTLALGLYQSNIGCACVLMLITLIRMLQNGAETKKVFCFIGRAIASLLCSCIFYKIIWDLSLKAWHVEASSYRGGGDLSVMKIIASMPRSIAGTYREFGRYFFENSLKHNAYQRLTAFHVMILCLILVTLILMEKKLAHRPLGAKLGAAACLLLIPPAANIALILAVDAGESSIQMTMPMATVFPFLLCAADFGEPADSSGNYNRRVQLTTGIRFLCMLALLIGSFLMISIDQHVMLKSRETAVNLLNRAAVDLGEDTTPEGGVFFAGRPSDNPVFQKDQLWERSNQYAHYGEFWLGGNLTTQSYFGYLRDAGLLMTFHWNEAAWDYILSRKEVRTMPVYPDDGSIIKIGNAVVVRFS